MSKKFAYSLDGEMYFGEYDSVDEALKEASFDGWDKECPTIWVAECYRDYKPSVSACWFLEDLQEDGYEDGGEWAESWLWGVTKEEQEDLQKSLDEVVDAWLKKYHYEPTWFKVRNETLYDYLEWKERLES